MLTKNIKRILKLVKQKVNIKGFKINANHLNNGKQTKSHWDKNPHRQKPTGTGQKATAISTLTQNRLKSKMRLFGTESNRFEFKKSYQYFTFCTFDWVNFGICH